MDLIRFEPEHLELLEFQPAQVDLGTYIAAGKHRALAAGGPAFTGLLDGEVVGSGGLIMLGEHRAVCWAILSDMGPKAFLRAHRAVRTFLDHRHLARIEANVDCEHENGHRWVRALGFEMEAERMRKFLPNGRDATGYVRVGP